MYNQGQRLFLIGDLTGLVTVKTIRVRGSKVTYYVTDKKQNELALVKMSGLAGMHTTDGRMVQEVKLDTLVTALIIFLLICIYIATL